MPALPIGGCSAVRRARTSSPLMVVDATAAVEGASAAPATALRSPGAGARGLVEASSPRSHPRAQPRACLSATAAMAAGAPRVAGHAGAAKLPATTPAAPAATSTEQAVPVHCCSNSDSAPRKFDCRGPRRREAVSDAAAWRAGRRPARAEAAATARCKR